MALVIGNATPWNRYSLIEESRALPAPRYAARVANEELPSQASLLRCPHDHPHASTVTPTTVLKRTKRERSSRPSPASTSNSLEDVREEESRVDPAVSASIKSLMV